MAFVIVNVIIPQFVHIPIPIFVVRAPFLITKPNWMDRE